MKNALLKNLQEVLLTLKDFSVKKFIIFRSLTAGAKGAVAFNPSEVKKVIGYVKTQEMELETSQRYVVNAISRFGSTWKDNVIIEENLTNCMVLMGSDPQLFDDFLFETELKLIREASRLLLIRFTQKGAVDQYDQFIGGLKRLVVARLETYLRSMDPAAVKRVCLDVLRARYDEDYLRFLMIEVGELREFEGLEFIGAAKKILADSDTVTESVTECEDPFELLWEWVLGVDSQSPIRTLMQLLDVFALINFTQSRAFPDQKISIEKKLTLFEGIEV